MGALLLLALRGENYAPQLQFSDEAEIATYVELYGQLTGQLSAKFELASSVDGPPIASAQASGQGTAEPDRFTLNGKIPIAMLSPGDYVVRVIVRLEGQPEGRAYRTLRKVAK